ncbi:MAG: UDP-2,3-diacylglucosamine diphosphatase, partial [Gammaproteobacteria bacterium]|nr:UDP-2,3-diacylglucosamine diphosphatase [Gammaproteobacteria bacterium]
HAEIRDIDGVRYVNCGDWVESHTAVVEHFDGSLELLRWQDARGDELGQGVADMPLRRAG